MFIYSPAHIQLTFWFARKCCCCDVSYSSSSYGGCSFWRSFVGRGVFVLPLSSTIADPTFERMVIWLQCVVEECRCVCFGVRLVTWRCVCIHGGLHHQWAPLGRHRHSHLPLNVSRQHGLHRLGVDVWERERERFRRKRLSVSSLLY